MCLRSLSVESNTKFYRDHFSILGDIIYIIIAKIIFPMGIHFMQFSILKTNDRFHMKCKGCSCQMRMYVSKNVLSEDKSIQNKTWMEKQMLNYLTFVVCMRHNHSTLHSSPFLLLKCYPAVWPVSHVSAFCHGCWRLIHWKNY